MALGNILREARISRGFTESEVAERIKMNAQMIVDLETENYSRIAAPIYGKGYIRKYAEFLGINYIPLVEEFKITFGSGNLEKPAVPLESFDPESGMLTKVIPAQANRQASDIQQPIATPVVQSLATPAQVVGQAPQTASNSLFSEFDSKSQSTPVTSQSSEQEEIFVPAHLATTPPTATIPPPNTVPDSVINSRYTSSPEKFTPRTTVFKPEQIPSASAPEPVALDVAPFTFPEAEVIIKDTEEKSPIIVTDEPEEDTMFSSISKKPKKPILSRYWGNTSSIEDEEETLSSSVKQKISFKERVSSFTAIVAKAIKSLKELLSSNAEDDITKSLAKKQRRLGLGLAIVIILIILVVACIGGGSSDVVKDTEALEVTETNEQEEQIPVLVVDNNPELTTVNVNPVEIVQILPTPKGFVE